MNRCSSPVHGSRFSHGFWDGYVGECLIWGRTQGSIACGLLDREQRLKPMPLICQRSFYEHLGAGKGEHWSVTGRTDYQKHRKFLLHVWEMKVEEKGTNADNTRIGWDTPPQWPVQPNRVVWGSIRVNLIPATLCTFRRGTVEDWRRGSSL